MTTPSASHFSSLPARRSRLAVVRDLVVVGLCALVVAGFLFGVGGGAQPTRQPAAATLSS